MIVFAFGLVLVLFANPVQRVFESMYFTPLTGLSLNTEAAAYASSLEIWSGYWQNAILNTAMLMLFAVPLSATYSQFHRQRT